MTLNFNFFSAILPIIIPLHWGIVFSINTYKRDRPRFILGITMFVSALTFLAGYPSLVEDYITYSYSMCFERFFLLLIHPFVYLYLTVLTSVNSRLNFVFVTGILPAFTFGVLFALLLHAMPAEERLRFVSDILYSKEDGNFRLFIGKIVYQFINLIFVIQSIVYFILTVRIIKKHTKSINDNYSNRKDLLIVVSFIFIIVCSAMSLILFADKKLLMGSPIYIPCYTVFSVLFLFLGIFGNRQKTVYSENYPYEETATEGKKTYHQSASSITLIKEQLLNYIEKKQMYLRPDLKITDLSRMLNCNRTYLSQVINSEFEVNFNTFVNRYRVCKAKELLITNDTYTLDYIAEQSGFGSISTFNRVFSQFEHKSPGRYRMEKFKTTEYEYTDN